MFPCFFSSLWEKLKRFISFFFTLFLSLFFFTTYVLPGNFPSSSCKTFSFFFFVIREKVMCGNNDEEREKKIFSFSSIFLSVLEKKKFHKIFNSLVHTSSHFCSGCESNNLKGNFLLYPSLVLYAIFSLILFLSFTLQHTPSI